MISGVTDFGSGLSNQNVLGTEELFPVSVLQMDNSGVGYGNECLGWVFISVTGIFGYK